MSALELIKLVKTKSTKLLCLTTLFFRFQVKYLEVKEPVSFLEKLTFFKNSLVRNKGGLWQAWIVFMGIFTIFSFYSFTSLISELSNKNLVLSLFEEFMMWFLLVGNSTMMVLGYFWTIKEIIT